MSTPHDVTYYPPDHTYIDSPAETAAEQQALYEAQQAEYSGSLPKTTEIYQGLTGTTPAPPPAITGTTPVSSLADAAATPVYVTVLGTGFTAASVILVDYVAQATDFTDAATIGVSIPSYTAPGEASIIVENGSVQSNEWAFAFTGAAEDPEADAQSTKKSKKG